MSSCMDGPFGDYLCQNNVKFSVAKICVEVKCSRKPIAFVLPHVLPFPRDWKSAGIETRAQRIVVLHHFICLQRSKCKVDLSKKILKYCKTFYIVCTLEICIFLGSIINFYENVFVASSSDLYSWHRILEISSKLKIPDKMNQNEHLY